MRKRLKKKLIHREVQAFVDTGFAPRKVSSGWAWRLFGGDLKMAMGLRPLRRLACFENDYFAQPIRWLELDGPGGRVWGTPILASAISEFKAIQEV